MSAGSLQAPAGGPVSRSGSATLLRWASRNARIIAPLFTLIVEFIFFSLYTDVFLTTRNMQNVITQVSPVAVAAVGITFVLLCAEIDLSIASVSVFCGVAATYIYFNDWLGLGQWGIVLAALGGIAMGFINGFLSSYVGIPSFMMTLAMLTVAAGLATYISKGQVIFDAPPILEYLGGAGNRVIGIPVIGIVALAALILGEFVLSYTKFGRYVYMTGGNREAAEMSGINTRMVLLNVMIISGFMAGIAGMLFVGRLKSANPAAGGNLLIDTIAAVVLGGTSLFGGEGGMKNTVLGLLIFAFLSNGLNLIPDLSIYFKQALQGIILIAALLLNVFALRLEKVQARTE
jgi:ribose transport system permease protein